MSYVGVVKKIAWNNSYGYNGCRHIFFQGTPSGKGLYDDGSGLDCTFVKDGKHFKECNCSPRKLILAPEDKLIRDVLWLRQKGKAVYITKETQNVNK